MRGVFGQAPRRNNKRSTRISEGGTARFGGYVLNRVLSQSNSTYAKHEGAKTIIPSEKKLELIARFKIVRALPMRHLRRIPCSNSRRFVLRSIVRVRYSVLVSYYLFMLCHFKRCDVMTTIHRKQRFGRWNSARRPRVLSIATE
jgi:hypothetical protein